VGGHGQANDARSNTTRRASGTVSVTALQPISKNVPVVFAVVAYPVGVGLVDNLAHPGGNVTGFMIYEYSLPGKWLEFLKQIAPTVTQVIVFRDPTNPSGIACRAVPTRLRTALPARPSFRGSLDGGSVEPISS
jgi:ABC transporter substrate binding protein